MQLTLLIAQMVISFLLIFLILIQEKGSGLGEAISGVGAQNIQMKKRGAEQVLAYITVVGVILFLSLSLVSNFIQ